MDFRLSQNAFNFYQYLSKRSILRASKRDLEREIVITVDRDSLFFRRATVSNRCFTESSQAVCVTRFDQSERVICVGIFALGKGRFEKCIR